MYYTDQFYALFYMTTVLKIPLVTVFIVLMMAVTIGSIFLVSLAGCPITSAAAKS